MSEETRIPDALMAPASWKKGENALVRGTGLVMACERVLGTDYAGGQRAYVRQGGKVGSSEESHFFVTNNPHDTLYFPSAHPRAGQPRYRWEAQEDGSVHGFLVDDEARKTTEGLK